MGKLRVLLGFELRRELESPAALLQRYAGILVVVLSIHFIHKFAFPGQRVQFIQGQGMDLRLFWLSGFALLQLVSGTLRLSEDALGVLRRGNLLEWLLLTPTSPWEYVLAFSLWRSLMLALEWAALLGFAACVMDLGVAGFFSLPVLGVTFLMGCMYAGLGMAVSAFSLVTGRGGFLLLLIERASRFLGGVYFPAALLPKALGYLALCLPVARALDAVRGLLVGAGSASTGLWGHLAPAAAAVLALGALALHVALRWSSERKWRSLSQLLWEPA